ncbi:ABC transporter permease [Glycomyces sp. NRRL B-16210]|uniref:ABC transporter permease n=1 Tax=Glycomyces sp. NRRL B-16210 TaxID=1463821 RepID=UPI0010D170FA|nr:ABC transporter permease [Glycomyces sp. NRRL B-16210]
MSSISPHPDGVSGPAGGGDGSPDTPDAAAPQGGSGTGPSASPAGYPPGAMSSGAAAFASPPPAAAPGITPSQQPQGRPGALPTRSQGPASYPAPSGQQPTAYGTPPARPGQAPYGAPPPPGGPQGGPQPYGAPQGNPSPPYGPPPPHGPYGQQPPAAAGPYQGQVPSAPHATRVEPSRDMPMAGASPIRRNLDDTAELPAFLDSARSDERPLRDKPEKRTETAVKPLKRKFPLTTGFTALLRHRYSLSVLIRRDLAVKYQATVMGYLWSLIEPLSLALIYWFVFGVLFQRDTGMPEGAENVGYALFIVSGIFAYQWFSSAVNEGAKSLGGQSSLITVMKVPREVFPVSKVFARFAEYVVGFPILIIVAVIFGGTFGLNLLWLIPAILVQAMLLTGLVFILSAANVLFKDVQRFLGLFMRLLFYASAIIYPITKVQDALENHPLIYDIYSVNPLIGIFSMHRAVFIPEFAPSWFQLGTAVGISTFLLFFGRWIFYRLEPRVLKAL